MGGRELDSTQLKPIHHLRSNHLHHCDRFLNQTQVVQASFRALKSVLVSTQV